MQFLLSWSERGFKDVAGRERVVTADDRKLVIKLYTKCLYFNFLILKWRKMNGRR